MSNSSGTIGPVRAWSLAAGGMVGGGIYIALGVIIDAAGEWAWLSFVIAGIAAVLTAFSYAALTVKFGASGGAFDFLEEVNRKSWAGSLSWLLILGYVLTISVYGFAFGNYVAYAFGGGEWLIRVLIAVIVAAIITLNLAGAGKLTSVEVVIVSGNLLILLALAAVGLWSWAPEQLAAGIETKPVSAALFGAAVTFVSYEGFQLLTYDYDTMDRPEHWFTPMLVSAAVFVVFVYVAVTLGATMISGAGAIVANPGVALSIAARRALGPAGLIAMTFAAAFATSAAINSTLFSTAKLIGRVARDGELPTWLGHHNSNDIPDRAVIGIGILAAALAMLGSLLSLVEAASLVFLFTFFTVNLIAAVKLDGNRWASWVGTVLSAIIGVALIARLFDRQPWGLACVLVLVAAIFLLRPLLFDRSRSQVE
ncbi:MAG: amino acid permease [Halioglobus sp.]|nr:amino acid permease [Halioglobus sp.]